MAGNGGFLIPQQQKLPFFCFSLPARQGVLDDAQVGSVRLGCTAVVAVPCLFRMRCLEHQLVFPVVDPEQILRHLAGKYRTVCVVEAVAVWGEGGWEGCKNSFGWFR